MILHARLYILGSNNQLPFTGKWNSYFNCLTIDSIFLRLACRYVHQSTFATGFTDFPKVDWFTIYNWFFATFLEKKFKCPHGHVSFLDGHTRSSNTFPVSGNGLMKISCQWLAWVVSVVAGEILRKSPPAFHWVILASWLRCVYLNLGLQQICRGSSDRKGSLEGQFRVGTACNNLILPSFKSTTSWTRLLTAVDLIRVLQVFRWP